VESESDKRFKILSYDETSNFSEAVELPEEGIGHVKDSTIKDSDLLQSEVFELKNLWYTYQKKINSILVVLPTEILNRYDMVAKSLVSPVFDQTKTPHVEDFHKFFNEITFKMAQQYFSVYQTIFAKNADVVKPLIQDFLGIQDPLQRSRQIIGYYKELHEIIDKKLHYIHKTSEEMKERNKTSLLEHAYQRVLEDTKKNDKTKYQEKLDAVKEMSDSIRKTLQEEIDTLDQKGDVDQAKKIGFLN